MRHAQIEVRPLHGDVAHARRRHVDLGAGDEAGVGEKVVEVARDVRDARDAAPDLRRERPQRVEPRERNALEHHVGRERATAPEGCRPQDRAVDAGAGPLRREDLVEHERTKVDVGPGDAALAVVPAERSLGVPLGEALAVQRDVAQVGLGVDGDVAPAARVLRPAERDVDVGAGRHGRVEPFEARILVEREHRQDVAHPEAGARSDRVDDEALRAAEPQRGRRHLVGAVPALGPHGRDVDLGLHDVDLDVPCREVAERDVRDREPRERRDVADRLRPIEDAVDVGARLELAAHRHVPDGREVVEIGLEVGDIHDQVVVKADRADPAVDARMRQEGPHLAELERLRPHREMGRELRLGEAEQALARAVLRRTVVDAERVRLGREVAVDLEGRQRARDRRRVDLANLPPDPGRRVDAQVAHQGREVDARRVEPRVLETPAAREGVDDRLGQDERSPCEVDRRLRAFDDVAPDR